MSSIFETVSRVKASSAAGSNVSPLQLNRKESNCVASPRSALLIPSSMYKAIFIVIFVAVFCVPQQPMHWTSAASQQASAWWQATFLPALPSEYDRYTAGQEIRIRVQTPVAVNVTALRTAVRVIAAYPSKGTSGTIELCNSSSHQVWQHFGDLGSTTPRENSTIAYATMLVPPFPWRVCISDYHTTWTDATGPSSFREFGSFAHLPHVMHVNESSHFYSVASESTTGDYAAIKIISSFAMNVPSSHRRGFDGDTVKLVPTGTPCSVEKTGSRETTVHPTNPDAYCGTSALNQTTGWWVTEYCMQEGSVASGVARVGTLSSNPFVDWYYASHVVTEDEGLAAYLKLPAAGTYDVCYSPLHYRRLHVRNHETSGASPVWFKLFQAGVDGCPSTGRGLTASCQPRTTRFTILAAPTAPSTWSSLDLSPGTWGNLKITGADLDSSTAQGWDCLGCSSINYFTTTGGDQLRLVHDQWFDSDSEVTPAPMLWDGARLASGLERRTVSEATGSYGTESLYLRYGGYNLGSRTQDPGCWYHNSDNYGSQGSILHGAVDTPGGDDGDAGVTATGDLGGNPRDSSTAYLANATGQSTVYAYLRIPNQPWHRYRVCYRKGGTTNWQVLDWNTAETAPSAGSVGTNGKDLVPDPKPIITNVTYYMNDTRASTLAEIVLHASSPILSTMPSTLYTASVVDSAVIHNALKIVRTGQSCSQDSAPLTRSESTDPGLPECAAYQCPDGVCSVGACQGSADDTTVDRKSVAFHLVIPSSILTYRVCFQHGLDNWRQLGTFVPQDAPTLAYTVTDTRAGATVALHFTQPSMNNYYFLDARGPGPFHEGDTVRIIASTTDGIENNCDVSYQPGARQYYDALMVASNLSAYCYSSGVAEGTGEACDPNAVIALDGGVNGLYPYTTYNLNANELLPASVGAAAFVTFPSTAEAGTAFKVCYKQRHLNWYEFSSTLTVTAPSAGTCTFSLPTNRTSLSQGESSYLLVQCTGEYTAASSLLKLVEASERDCHVPAAGSTTTGLRHSAFTYASSLSPYTQYAFANCTEFNHTTNGVFAYNDTGCGDTSLGSLGRAYMQFPVSSSGSTDFKVCFADAQASTTGWLQLGTLSLAPATTHYETAPAPVYHQQSLSVTIVATEPSMNTSIGGDTVKLVSLQEPCELVNGSHVGAFIADDHTFPELVDLGPTDNDRAMKATFDFTLPAASATDCYKLCLKGYGRPWTEITSTTGAALCPTAAPVFSAAIYDGILTRHGLPLQPDEERIGVVAGTSTHWIYATNNQLILDGIPIHYGDVSFIQMLQTPASSTDKLKFVPLPPRGARGHSAGNYKAKTCLDEGHDGDAMTTVATDGKVSVHFPMLPGDYLVCYYQNSRWIALRLLNSTNTTQEIPNPLTIFPSSLSFDVVTSENKITLKDLYVSHSGDAASYGALHARDAVYFVGATDVCGVANSALRSTNDHLLGSIARLDGNDASTSSYLAYRTTSSNSSNIPTTAQLASGRFSLCYYRVSEDRVNSSSTIAPYVRANVWYRVPYLNGMIYAGHYTTMTPRYLVTTGCPTGSPFSNGEVLSASVAFKDSTQTVTLSPMLAVGVTATANFNFTTVKGQCSRQRGYELYETNITVGEQMLHGTAPGGNFQILPTGPCPDSGCNISFTALSSSIDSNSASCAFNVTRTALTSIALDSVDVTSCVVGRPCPLRVVGFDSNGEVAYNALDETITLTVTNSLGGVTWTTQQPPQFLGGYLHLMLLPTHTDPSDLSAWVGSFNQTATVSVTTGTTALSLTHALVVSRSALHALYILDVAEVDFNGHPTKDIQIPTWEPSASHSGRHWDRRSSVLSSVPDGLGAVTEGGHYLVAGRYYRFDFAATDLSGQPLDYRNPVSWTFDASFSVTNRTINTLIGLPAGGTAANPHYAVPFTGATITQADLNADGVFSVYLRFKNSRGCKLSDGGCTVAFTIDGVAPTAGSVSIQTYVRGVATQLAVSCNGGAFSGEVTCPQTTVEDGVSIDVQAQDPFGDVDEYYHGSLVPQVLIQPTASMQSADLSTVALMRNRLLTDVSLQPVHMTAGLYSFAGLTLTRPCSTGCGATFISDWGANAASVAMPTALSTKKLMCALESTVYHRINDTIIAGDNSNALYNNGSTAYDLSSALIYPDTELCFVVWAANDAGQATLHETNWVYYGLQSNVSTTPRNTRFLARIQPLSRSVTRFCFVIITTEAARVDVMFNAQRFDTNIENDPYWALANGDCRVNGLQVYPKKIPAKLMVSQTSGSMTPMDQDPYKAPSTNLWLWSQYATIDTVSSATHQVDVILHLYDHYGNAVEPADTQQGYDSGYVGLDNCLASDLSAGSCGQGVGKNVAGQVYVRPLFSGEEGGVVAVSVQSSSTSISSIAGIKYTLLIKQFCLHCRISFTLRNSSDISQVDPVFGTLTASMTITLLLPLNSYHHVAFKLGTSPLANGNWPDYSASSHAASAVHPNASRNLLMYPSTCTDRTADCFPVEPAYLQPICDGRRRPDTISNGDGGDLQMYVMSSTEIDPAVALTSGQSSCLGADCFVLGAARNQINIYTAFELGVSVGTQTLRCVNTPCIQDDSTTVTQVITSNGNTTKLAILALVDANDDTLPSATAYATTAFQVQGYNPSNTYVVSSTDNKLTTGTFPSPYTAPFATAGTSNVTGMSINTLTAPGSFSWRGSLKAARLVVRREAGSKGECSAKIHHATHLGPRTGGGGYPLFASVEELGFRYAARDGTVVVANHSFPVTVELQDHEGNVSVGANDGTVRVYKAGNFGCGDGGVMSVVGGTTQTISGGRTTFWVSFSEPCENCALMFALQPSSSSVYDNVRGVEGVLYATSDVFQVRDRHKSHNWTAHVDVPHALGQGLPSTLFVGTPLSVPFEVMQALGRYTTPFAAPLTRVFLYNSVRESTPYMVWKGTGGVLAGSVGARPAVQRRHVVATTVINAQTGTVNFAFTKTCYQCELELVFEVSSERPNGMRQARAFTGAFLLRSREGTSLFNVQVPPYTVIFAGLPPPRGVRRVAFSASLWSVGPDHSGIANAPLASLSSMTMTLKYIFGFAVNGDGGVVTTRSITQSNGLTRVWRLLASGPCGMCHLAVNDGAVLQAPISILTVATHLRVTHISPLQLHPGGALSVSLHASDETGIPDIGVGGPTNCSLYHLFQCTPPLSRLVVYGSVDGVDYDGFSPTLQYMHAGGSDPKFQIQAVNQLFSDGLIANGQLNFTSPVRIIKPIFGVLTTRGTLVTSQSTASLIPTLSVVVPSLVGVGIAAEHSTYHHHTLESLTIRVAAVKSYDVGSTQYIAAGITADVTISYSSECKRSGSITLPLYKGMMELSSLYEATPTGSPCTITFTLKPTAGATCINCQASVTVNVVDPPVAGWRWIRPSTFENGAMANIQDGPRYATNNRRQFLVAEAVALVNGQWLPTKTQCTTCVLTLTPSTTTCPQQPTISPSNTVTISNAQASMVLQWPANSTSNYRCGMTAQLKKGSTVINHVSGVSTWSANTEICNPTAVKLLTNVTTVTGGSSVLRTGVRYNLTVAVVDADGNVCRGDSQDDATSLTVSVPGQTSSLTRVMALNLNTDQAVSQPVVYGVDAVRNTVQAIGGIFNFSVVFTASTSSAQVLYVVLRFEGKSHRPTLDAMIESTPFTTVVRASRVRIRHDKALAQYYVYNRTMFPVNGGQVVVQAVDSLKVAWAQHAPNVPNVPKTSSEYGHDALVEWVVDPLYPNRPFPLTFDQGARGIRLIKGETLASFRFTGDEGTYQLWIRHKDGTLASSAPSTIIVQKIATPAMKMSTQSWCTVSGCSLATPFTQTDGRAVLHQHSIFHLTVAFADLNGNPVLGDATSAIGVRVRKTSTTNVILKDELSDTVGGPHLATVVQGAASFALSFVGTTSADPIQLEVFCPQWITRNGAVVLNPCALGGLALQPLLSQYVTVLPDAPTRDVPALIRDYNPLIRIPTYHHDLTTFNITHFKLMLLESLGNTSHLTGWPHTANTLEKVTIIACEINKAQFGAQILTGYVCQPHSVCASPYDFSCPPAVRLCACPSFSSSSSTATRRRQLLQQTTLNVQLELTFNLSVSDVEIIDDIPGFYASVSEQTLSQLRDNTVFESYLINKDGVSVVTGLVTPVPLMNTSAPTTAAPSTTTAAAVTTSGAAGLQPSFLLLAVAVLASLLF